MKKFLSCAIMVFATVATTAANAKTYDCHVDPPLALDRDGNTATLKPINFPQLKSEPWTFSVSIEKGKSDEPDVAHVTWPSNPIQIAGDFPVLPTANGALAFTAIGFDGCMFTVGACLAIVQIADQEAGTAKISIQPSALWTDDKTNRSDPFVAVIDGTCTWKES
jgi:hypothetical protein